MTSMLDEIKKISDKAKTEGEDRYEKLKVRQDEIKDTKFTFLTDKYYDLMIDAITKSASLGYKKKYMNFTRDDFKANCHGLGTPDQFQAKWFEEISKPDSKYLPKDEDGNTKSSFKGFEFNIWNNNSFTTVISWE